METASGELQCANVDTWIRLLPLCWRRQGSRLHPLTAERCKPAVPFGARYRIVDFVLSNLINSGIRAIYLLVQYKRNR